MLLSYEDMSVNFLTFNYLISKYGKGNKSKQSQWK